MQTKKDLEVLLEKYLASSLSDAEREAFKASLENGEEQTAWHEIIGEMLFKPQDYKINEAEWQPVIAQILSHKEEAPAKVVKMNPWRRIAAAIAVVLLLSVAYIVFRTDKKPVEVAQNPSTQKNDIPAPTNNRARITLADGRIVSLDSVNAGTLATQGNTKVTKNDKGEIVYQSTGAEQEITYNTLYNPRGSKAITLTLTDGSQVWLNAESSLRYPTSFTGNERKVEITGEAYFEVAHNTAMPFIVAKNNVEVKVLGTHFNVNTYDNEETLKVTLLEGSVKVTAGEKNAILVPGKQAAITKNGNINLVNADVDEVIAWKNGKFSFTAADIKTIMREISRWYDVNINFEKEVKEVFYVKMDRNTNVSNVFKILETTGGVHFKIDGRKITVLP